MEALDTFIMPQQFKHHLERHEIVELDDVTILESCHDDQHEVKGVGYTTQHEILHVIHGRCKLTIDGRNIELFDGQSILMPKHTILKYQKMGAPYQSILFFLKDEFIMEFLQDHSFKEPWQKLTTPYAIFRADPLLDAAFQSMRPYIRNAAQTSKELFRIKTFEILLNLSYRTKGLPEFLSNMVMSSKIDLRLFMENMYIKKMNLKELAEISGRSLSAFKREFEELFGTSPFRWIKEKRLQTARELIVHSGKRPTEIYLDVGFEDYSHFSKSYKSHFGYLPSHTLRTS
ncbi:AraC family transcriptional regulator [Ulvibacterium marinum]|uniref:AraC family transcriptional regulator n=1 Tax=Ulvibacterium marinum TaxID=2419782 RepID=A0A3B0C0U0_9FLAO|nr:helix-turn-helix domain-containing protein [Ulvibacterium marinum]RKN79695.1 AraC family transcriptional regulator [Ulvibacterium marinum]